jgi:predicted nuclease of predicted toxin-antitoxin system
MSIAILVDMNLSPDWIPLLRQEGWSAIHWSDVGDPRADDAVIMAWALANQHIIFTHDLDFGTMLALTRALGPSVIQVRGNNVLTDHMGAIIITAIHQHEADLAAGALLVVDEARRRVRVLPV